MPMCETSITLWYTQTMEYYIIIKNNEGTYSWKKKENLCPHKKLHAEVRSFIYNNKLWKPPRCPLVAKWINKAGTSILWNTIQQ